MSGCCESVRVVQVTGGGGADGVITGGAFDAATNTLTLTTSTGGTVTITGIDPSGTLYAADGQLAGARTVDMDGNDITWQNGGDFIIDGKLTVTGLIDPTGMQFSGPQPDATMPNETIFITDGSESGYPVNTFVYKDNAGGYHSMGDGGSTGATTTNATAGTEIASGEIVESSDGDPMWNASGAAYTPAAAANLTTADLAGQGFVNLNDQDTVVEVDGIDIGGNPTTFDPTSATDNPNNSVVLNLYNSGVVDETISNVDGGTYTLPADSFVQLSLIDGTWYPTGESVGGTVSSGFLVSDLVADADHTQDFAGFNQTWNNVGTMNINLDTDQASPGALNVTSSLSIGVQTLTANLAMSAGGLTVTHNPGSPVSINSELQIDGSPRFGAVGDVGFGVLGSGQAAHLGEPGLIIQTPQVIDGAATGGQLLSLVNSATGEVEFIDAPSGGSLNLFENDDTLQGPRNHELDGNDFRMNNAANGTAYLFGATQMFVQAQGSAFLQVDGAGVNLGFQTGDSFRINGDSGNAGQVLQSNGSAAPPTWVTLSGANLLSTDLVQTANRTHDFNGNNQIWNEMGQFNITYDNTATPTENLIVTSTNASFNITQQSTAGDGQTMAFRVDGDIGYMRGTSTTGDLVEVSVALNGGDHELRLVTPEVSATNATAGQLLSLVNATSGEVEFIDAPSGGGGGALDNFEAFITTANVNDGESGKHWYDDTNNNNGTATITNTNYSIGNTLIFTKRRGSSSTGKETTTIGFTDGSQFVDAYGLTYDPLVLYEGETVIIYKTGASEWRVMSRFGRETEPQDNRMFDNSSSNISYTMPSSYARDIPRSNALASISAATWENGDWCRILWTSGGSNARFTFTGWDNVVVLNNDQNANFSGFVGNGTFNMGDVGVGGDFSSWRLLCQETGGNKNLLVIKGG